MKIKLLWQHASHEVFIEAFEIGKEYNRVLHGSLGDDNFTLRAIHVEDSQFIEKGDKDE